MQEPANLVSGQNVTVDEALMNPQAVAEFNRAWDAFIRQAIPGGSDNADPYVIVEGK